MRSAGRGADQRQSLDPVGHGDGELLGDHPAEAAADDPAGGPTDVIEEGDGVGGVLRHRVRAHRYLGASQSTLIMDEDLEGQGVAVEHRPGLLDRCARAVEHEQPWTVPESFEVDLDSVESDACRSVAGRRCRAHRAPTEGQATKPSCSTTQVPSSGNPGVERSAPSQPATINETAASRPPLPGR